MNYFSRRLISVYLFFEACKILELSEPKIFLPSTFSSKSRIKNRSVFSFIFQIILSSSFANELQFFYPIYFSFDPKLSLFQRDFFGINIRYFFHPTLRFQPIFAAPFAKLTRIILLLSFLSAPRTLLSTRRWLLSNGPYCTWSRNISHFHVYEIYPYIYICMYKIHSILFPG